MSNLKALSDAAFDVDVLGNPLPVLVEFTAPWCPPCRAIEPHLEALATRHQGRLVVGKLDTDQHQQMSQRYGIRGLPTVILFSAGKPVASIVGAAPAKKFEELVEKHVLQRG